MKKNKKVKDIPEFKNETEERAFWDTNSAFDYPDRFKPVKLHLPNLKKAKSSLKKKFKKVEFNK